MKEKCRLYVARAEENWIIMFLWCMKTRSSRHVIFAKNQFWIFVSEKKLKPSKQFMKEKCHLYVARAEESWIIMFLRCMKNRSWRNVIFAKKQSWTSISEKKLKTRFKVFFTKMWTSKPVRGKSLVQWKVCQLLN